MARPGDVPAANRYSGLSLGPDSQAIWETQEGLPVDGTRAFNRELSPFTISLVPPDVLFATSAAVESIVNRTNAPGQDAGALEVIGAALSRNLDSIDAAASESNTLGSDTRVFDALSRVSLVDTDTTILRQVVADGVLLSERGDTAYSTLADAATAADIALQLQAMLGIPPLTLLVNPTSMTLNFTKLQNYGTRVRNGYVFEAWGEEQPKLSISASTGGFLAGVGNGAGNIDTQFSNQASSVTGYQWASRRDSAAWQNFMSLYTFYRNNGYIYDTIRKSEAHLFIGAVVITYDQWSYVGHFESFDFSFDEANQHRVEFSIEFTVSQAYDSAQTPMAITPQNAPTTSLSDPRYTQPGPRGAQNGAVDLVSRTERQQFGSDVADLAQNPLELFR